jgi:predicted nuclease with TOPRIM domain
MAGLWALPLLALGRLAAPCNLTLVKGVSLCVEQDPPSALEQCKQECGEYEQKKAECEADLQKIEAESDAKRKQLREEWMRINEEVKSVSAKVEEKEKKLDVIEEENDKLHQELINELGAIGLAQTGNLITPEEETQQWLECLDKKTDLQLAASQCSAERDAVKARASATHHHYSGLKDAANQNKAMVTSRLEIIEDMIDNAIARKERLVEQVAGINSLKLTKLFVYSRSRRSKVETRAIRLSHETDDHGNATEPDPDPVEEARERLKTIDDEIAQLQDVVERCSAAADQARAMMDDEAKTQRKVAAKLRVVKNETMSAFRKAFALDYELDTLETMHDEAYIAAKNATTLFEAMATKEHEATAELQKLITKKHRLLHIIAKAEDAESADEPTTARPRLSSAALGFLVFSFLVHE